MTKQYRGFTMKKGLILAGCSMLLSALSGTVQAQAIFVPNHSFESQSAVGYLFGTNPNLDSWQKIAEPSYFGPAFGGMGIGWTDTAGGFLNVATNTATPYINVVGDQAGYILAAPQVTLYQDYNSSAGHDFNATFEIGKTYTLTLGLFGKNTLAPGSTFEMSLYYRNGLDNKVKVGSRTITYSSDLFPTSGALSLIDFEVSVPTVNLGDAWAGQHIGIQLESTIPIELTTLRNWDFDNVRLTAVPEPGTISLLGLGLLGGCYLRFRSRKQA